MTVALIADQGVALIPNVIGVKTFSDGAALIIEEIFTSKWGTWTLAVPRRVKKQHSFTNVQLLEVQ